MNLPRAFATAMAAVAALAVARLPELAETPRADGRLVVTLSAPGLWQAPASRPVRLFRLPDAPFGGTPTVEYRIGPDGPMVRRLVHRIARPLIGVRYRTEIVFSRPIEGALATLRAVLTLDDRVCVVRIPGRLLGRDPAFEVVRRPDGSLGLDVVWASGQRAEVGCAAEAWEPPPLVGVDLERPHPGAT